MTARASGSFFVKSRRRTLPLRGSGERRSTICPSTSATTAALARPGPIDAVTSYAETGSVNSLILPSGRVTVSIFSYGLVRTFRAVDRLLHKGSRNWRHAFAHRQQPAAGPPLAGAESIACPTCLG